MWGVKNQEVHVNVYVRPRAQPKQNPSSAMGRKNPSSAMWRILLGMDAAEDKGDNLPLVITLQIVPRNRKSTKTERDSGENGNVRGKS